MNAAADRVSMWLSLEAADRLDDALDAQIEDIEDWFRGGAVDAIAEALELLHERGASLQLLVSALAFTCARRSAWTWALRAARSRVYDMVIELDPGRSSELLMGLSNDEGNDAAFSLDHLLERNPNAR